MKLATRRRNARATVRPGGALFLVAAAITIVIALPVILLKLILSRA